MTPPVFKVRRQWVALGQSDGIATDITITRHDWTSTSKEFTWWIDASDVSTGLKKEEFSASSAASLFEAKRRALQQTAALVARMVAARGGA